MQEIVVIDGEISLENTLDGEVELEAITDLDPEVVLSTGGAVYPHYDGSYTVTPSGSVQVLDTSDKVMDDDVTVQAVAQGSATTPATIITADPTISVSSGGLITATVSKTQQITPTVQEGYVSAGTPGNVGVSGSNTEQLTVQSAQTIYPASTDQSIASGKYLTGNQTFKAVTVSGLTADKILQGTTVEIGDSDDSDRIMKVVGTAQGGITPTGTKSITANGTGIDVCNYQYADVAVPNSYSSSDEGKVVSNGALVAQTSDTVTANDTYDTTLINSLTVNVSGGGGDDDTPLKDVVFIDYDGSIIQQYTKSEFLALESMPANPTHTGLTAQGWNWTLADAKTYVTNYDYLCIGQSYITSDGKTRIYFNVNDININRELEIRMYTSVKGGATIDWDDGTTTTTTANADSIGYYKHTYTTKGDYLITITVTSGKISLGFNGSNGTLFGQNDVPAKIVATAGVKKIELGSNIANIYRSAFRLACHLESITIPTGVTFASGGNLSLFVTVKMKGLVIPKEVTTIGPIGDIHSLEMISLPKELTTLHASPLLDNRSTDRLRMLTFANSAIAFDCTILQNGGALVEKYRYTGSFTTVYGNNFVNSGNYLGYVDTDILIPSQVTQIKDYAYTGTIPLKHYHIKATTPPTLGNARAFGRLANFTKIYVPYSADHSVLTAYQTATNWSSMTGYIEEEPQ